MTLDLTIADSVKSFDVPLGELQLQYPGKRLVVGVAIVPTSQTSSRVPRGSPHKLILLQRVATEDAYPLMYELPGGHAEPEDATLLHTAVREVKEETGLSLTHILGTFPGFEYGTPSKGMTIQFNFLAGVKAGTERDVQLNPEEHRVFVWVDKMDDLSRYPMTPNMAQVVSDALKAIEEIVF